MSSSCCSKIKKGDVIVAGLNRIAGLATVTFCSDHPTYIIHFEDLLVEAVFNGLYLVTLHGIPQWIHSQYIFKIKKRISSLNPI